MPTAIETGEQMRGNRPIPPHGHVLVVDDDEGVHRLLAPALASRNLVAHSASTISQAHQLLRDHVFDLVVLDGRLPDGDGIELLEKLRGAADTAPIMYISAYCREPARTTYLKERLGVAEVLPKPFSTSELISRAQALIELSRRTRPPRSVTDSATIRTPATSASDLQEKFKQLRDKYAAKLPAKFANICALLEKELESETLEQARTLAHRLRGTAGSYGFSDVGRAAGQLEDQLLRVIGGDTAAEEASQSFAASLRSLRTAIERACEGGQHSSAAWSERAAISSIGHAPAPAEQEQPAASPGGTVLLLSPDAALAQQLGTAAGTSLLDAFVTSSVEEAVERARQTPIAAALIDVELSNVESAVDAARQLRAVHDPAGLPLAFVSADGALEARIAATQAHADLFLTKPLGDHELVDALRQMTAAQESQQPRLLLVDDDPDFAEALVTLLGGERLDIHVLLDPARIVETLDDVRPDVLLLDMVLPHVSGLQLCRIVRTNPRWQMLPVLMLTSLSSEEARLSAFEAGADDYLLKPIVKQELLARLRLRLDHARLVHERSTRDALTGVLTRRAFVEGFTARLAETDRRGGQLSFCLFDLDHFKAINDTHGHLAGDRVLGALGRALEARLRDCDLRGRWGGEEFVVVFQGADTIAATDILARLQRELRETVFLGDKGERFHATFSAGVSAYPGDGTTMEELISVADRRLYRAKRGGRDLIQLADE